jgi:hypothetical protein
LCWPQVSHEWEGDLNQKVMFYRAFVELQADANLELMPMRMNAENPSLNFVWDEVGFLHTTAHESGTFTRFNNAARVSIASVLTRTRFQRFPGAGNGSATDTHLSASAYSRGVCLR